MQPIILRDDQQDLKGRIYNDWNHGAQNVCGVLSTGGGKSIIVSDIILDGARAGEQQAVIAHRNELVGQMSMHIANRGIYHRIIGSAPTVAQITRAHRKKFGRSFVNPSAPTGVVGVDTLLARKDSLISWTHQVSKWVIDEGHHVLLDNKWGKAAKLFPRARGLGVTATPMRADGMGLGRETDGIYDTMQIGMDMRALINIGALSDYGIVCPPSDLVMNDNELGETGDWSSKKMRKKARASNITGCVVTNYCKYAFGKQAICFATDVETAGKIADQFNAVGIRAASLSAETNVTVREKYIDEFKAGKLLVLVNVDLFDEGFDVPACEVVIMARPTASLGKYRQMVGRCLRTAQGKLYGLIIDHVGNVVRHGYPDKFIAWSLGRRERRSNKRPDPDELDLTTCKFCTKPYYEYLPACPHCGMAPPLPIPRERKLEHVKGDLILLDPEQLAKIREAMRMESPGEIAARVAYVAGDLAGRGAANRQIEKIQARGRLEHAIAQWAGVERFNGTDDSVIYRKFYLATGMSMAEALNASFTRADFDAMAQRVEGWYL